MALAALRARVDEVDQQIVALLAERRRLVAQMGPVKAALGLPALDPGREAEARARLLGAATNLGLPELLVQQIFDAVLADSRQVVSRSLIGSGPG